MVEKISYCRNCAANCGLVLDINDNRIDAIKADQQHPLAQGYVCIKGTMAADLHNGGENRLTHCLQRNKQDDLEAIDKHQAVSEIANRLQQILSQHGPRAFASYWGTYSYFDCVGKTLLKNIMADLGSPGIFSSMTLDQSSKWVTASRMGVWANGKPVSSETDVILVAGCNPPISHQGYPMVPYPTTNISKHIRDAKQRGVKLIVIDPRNSELARRADLFIQPKPGFDAAIFASMVREILHNQTYSQDFSQRWTHNLEQLRNAVAPFTPERVARVADIQPDSIRLAVKWLVNAKQPGLGTGTGVDMARYSNTAEHLFEALTALVGGYVTAGDKIPNPGILFPRPSEEMVYPPNRTWETAPFCGSDNRFGKLMGEFPSSLLPDEILHDGPDKIRALFVIGGNPVMALGDPAKTAEAFKHLELLVVIDPRADSATAQYADFVLAPTLQFERDELTSFTEFAFHEPFVQYAEAALQPPPQTLGEDEFAWLLARHLGIDLRFKYLPFGANYADIPDGLALDMTQYCGRQPIIDWMLQQQGLSLEDLKKHPHGLRQESDNVLQPATTDDGARLDLCPDDVAAEINEVAHWLDEQHQSSSFLLFSRRLTESYNSSFLGHPITRNRHPVNHLHLNPDDISTLHLKDNDAVLIRSQHGEILGYARTDKSVKTGTASMAHCWGTHHSSNTQQGCHTGQLVSLDQDLQSINRMPLQTGITVELIPQPINRLQPGL